MATSSNPDKTNSGSSDLTDTGNNPGVTLRAPHCETAAALPTPTTNSMALWLKMPLSETSVGQPHMAMGQLIVNQDWVFVSGARKIHRIDLQGKELCNFASPNEERLPVSAISRVNDPREVLVSFREPGRKEGQMGRYTEHGNRYIPSFLPKGAPATALFALPESQDSWSLLAAFPGKVFSQSYDQGQNWSSPRATHDALYDRFQVDRGHKTLWAFGQDTAQTAWVTWAKRASLQDPEQVRSGSLARWPWDASSYESIQPDPSRDASLLVGTTAKSTGEPLLARVTVTGTNNTLSVRELWTGASTSPFSGVTAILPRQGSADAWIVGGRAKKSGASVLAYLDGSGKAQDISVDTERKLQVLDIQPFGSAPVQALVSSTDGTSLFLHVLGPVQMTK